MKLPAILSEGFLQSLSEDERKKLGPAGITRAEALAKYRAGQEKQLQDDVTQWLNLHEIYFESDRMDKRTSGKKGRPDFRCCVKGHWISFECKTEAGTLSKEQAEQAARLRKSGGIFVLVFSLQDVIAAIRDAGLQI
jgi:hypothetical protein